MTSTEETGPFADSYQQLETWLCNHCPDYLSPGPSPSLVGTSKHGAYEHAFQHVQTVYVRFDAAMLVSPKILISDFKAQYRPTFARCGSVPIPRLYPDLGVNLLI